MKKVIFIVSIIYSQYLLSQCIGDCMNGKGTYNWDSGHKYSGYWSDGKYQNGSMSYPKGSRYEGNWKNNEFHGFGKYWQTGDQEEPMDKGWYYEGNWENGKMNGKGIYVSRIHEVFNPKGDKYEGSFLNDKENGYGVKFYRSIFSIVEKYEGYFKDGYENGSCTITFDEGGIFEGEIYNGLYVTEDTTSKNGAGKLLPSFNGVGVYSFSDGQKYKGEFKRVNEGRARGEEIIIGETTYRVGDTLPDDEKSVLSDIFWENYTMVLYKKN